MKSLRGTLLIISLISLLLALPALAQETDQPSQTPMMLAQNDQPDEDDEDFLAGEEKGSEKTDTKTEKPEEPAEEPAEATVEATTVPAKKPNRSMKKGYFGSVRANKLEIAADLDAVDADRSKHRIRLEFYGNGQLRTFKSLSRDEWKAVVAAYHKASVRANKLKAGQKSLVATKSEIIIHAIGTDSEDEEAAGGLVKMYLYDEKRPGVVVLGKPHREKFIEVIDRTNKYYGLATVTGKKMPLPKPPYKVYER